MAAPDCCTIPRTCWLWHPRCRCAASGPARRTPPWSGGSPISGFRSSRRQCPDYIAGPLGTVASGPRQRTTIPGHASWPTPKAQLFALPGLDEAFIQGSVPGPGLNWSSWYMSMTAWWNVCVLPSGWKLSRLSCGRSRALSYFVNWWLNLTTSWVGKKHDMLSIDF